MEMFHPDYRGGSIINLMSSIKRSFGGSHQYPPLEDFDSSRLRKKDIVLLTLDGLGYEFLVKYGRDTFLSRNLNRKLTSVFPTTTATAMTALNIGTPAQQHGMTGWDMYLREIGMVATPLPFVSRSGNFSLADGKVIFDELFHSEKFIDGDLVDQYSLKSGKFSTSPYSKFCSKGAKMVAYETLDDALEKTKKILGQKKGKPKYINIYWPELDSIIHNKGTNSAESVKHLKLLDKKIRHFSLQLRGSKTVLIVTADHGLIDTPKVIRADEHPKFYETLAVPLCGDSRLAYCYVKPGMSAQFEKYVRTEFGDACEMRKSGELLKENYFGLFKCHSKIHERIGDYTLIMKGKYIMKDKLMAEKFGIKKANHGGMSKEEMLVPLIIIDCEKSQNIIDKK